MRLQHFMADGDAWRGSVDREPDGRISANHPVNLILRTGGEYSLEELALYLSVPQLVDLRDVVNDLCQQADVAFAASTGEQGLRNSLQLWCINAAGVLSRFEDVVEELRNLADPERAARAGV